MNKLLFLSEEVILFCIYIIEEVRFESRTFLEPNKKTHLFSQHILLIEIFILSLQPLSRTCWSFLLSRELIVKFHFSERWQPLLHFTARRGRPLQDRKMRRIAFCLFLINYPTFVFLAINDQNYIFKWKKSVYLCLSRVVLRLGVIQIIGDNFLHFSDI